MPDFEAPGQVARAWTRDLGAAAFAAAHVVLAWFAPALVAPLVLLWVACAAWHPRLRAAFTPRVLGAAAGLLAFLLLKDLATPGPFASALGRLDPLAAAPLARQPDTPGFLVSLGRVAAILLALPLLRVLLVPGRRARSFFGGLALALAGLACALLTHPAPTEGYGRAFRLGEVASRNPAAGAFALGAILALGAGLSAIRAGRWRALPAFAASGVCAAAVLALGSRGGLLALGAGIAALLYQENRDKIGRAVTLAAAAAIVILLFAPGPLSRLVAEGEGYRLELAGASLRALALAPWGGLGLGGFAPGFALFGELVPAEGMRVIHPDNGWILLFVEWGALGIGAAALAGFLLLRPRDGERDASPTARAVLAAWGVAALGDVSFHRVELLVLGLPALAACFPAPEPAAGAAPRRRRPLALLVSVLALGAAAAGLAGEAWLRAARDPARSDPRLAAALPLDPAVRHLSGNRALERGDLDRAAVEYTVASALDPANTLAIQAYARAFTGARPELATPLWRRLFAGAGDGPRAADLLREELSRPGTRDAYFWMEVLDARPALWVVAADTELRGAQPAYERWRRRPAAERAASPWRSALGASARWGGAREFAQWLGEDPARRKPAEIAFGGDFLRERGRDDLAWLWLSRHLPAPAPRPPASPDPLLRAFVLANPDDALAAARLLEQTESGPERLAILERLVARPRTPASFRIRLAYELHAAGRTREALTALQAAAAAMAAQE